MAVKSSASTTASVPAAKRRTQSKATGGLLASLPGIQRGVNLPANPAAGAVSSAQSRSPVLSQPSGGTTQQVQIAPAPQPFLNPDDEAARSTDIAAQDSYLAGLGQQLTGLQIDTNLKLGDIQRSLGQGLEANDWNTAARGLQDSSIKSQNRAQMTTQSAANEQAQKDTLSNFDSYVGGEKNRVDTIIKPGIQTHYDAVAQQNARNVGPTYGEVNVPDATPAAGPGAAPATSSTPASAPPGGATHTQQGVTSPTENIVKDGKFYHVYTKPDGSKQWVYVRPAS